MAVQLKDATVPPKPNSLAGKALRRPKLPTQSHRHARDTCRWDAPSSNSNSRQAALLKELFQVQD